MELVDRLVAWIGEEVVIDVAASYVVLGKLVQTSTTFLELADADLHDLRDTTTSRENYVMKTARHGVTANRKTVLLPLRDIVAIALLRDVVTG